jgi:hypothetical protein
MKTLKSIFLASVLTVGAFATTFFTACNPDACKDVICANAGTCTDGTCTCPAGYEGTLCETKSNAKFINAAGWQVTEDGTQSTAASYIINITPNGTVANGIYISNVWDNFVGTVNATVNGSTITIPRQAPDSDGFYVEGTGTLNSNLNPVTITVKYKVTDETGTPIVTDDFGLVSGSASTWSKK